MLPTKLNPAKMRLPWEITTLYGAKVAAGDRTLAFAVQCLLLPGEERPCWNAIAVEAGTRSGGVDAVFDDHSHQNLGAFPTTAEAVNACEVYARQWARKHRPKRAPKCPCEPISKAG